jgi:hypothetical protein
MKREDEEQHGFADPLSVIADLLGENRMDLMMFWARKMPGEAMSLAKQSTKESSSQRRSLLRYATVMVSREKASFVAWRDEVELVKLEKKEEEERLQRELARQRKMKRGNLHNLSSYEGGKPVAVKTLGHQIASIYQAKAVSDDLMDSNGCVCVWTHALVLGACVASVSVWTSVSHVCAPTARSDESGRLAGAYTNRCQYF